MNILDARRGVGFELSASLAKQELNGCEVTFVDAQVPSKLGPGELLKVRPGALR